MTLFVPGRFGISEVRTLVSPDLYLNAVLRRTASSMAAWEFQMLQNIAEKNGWTKFISMQNYYNLIVSAPFSTMAPANKLKSTAKKSAR